MNTVAVVGRLLLSLAVVLGLMWIIARRVRRGAGGRARNGRVIDVLSRQQLSRTASVAVVRVLDQALILGVTDGQINVLGKADLDAARASVDADPPRRIVPVKSLDAAPARQVASQSLDAAPARQVASRAVVAPGRPKRVARAAGVEQSTAPAKGVLAGSALSLGTWKQAVESLRDLTARKT
jgi:flagellar protein FliO/FliZ